MDWCICYSDGATFSSEDGEWEDAPPFDVQAVLFREPTQDGMWTIRHGGDFYRLAEDGSCLGMDEDGMKDYVLNILRTVKMGRGLTRAEWNRISRESIKLRDELRLRDRQKETE